MAWTESNRYTWHKCRLDGCRSPTWRRCRVCERWVCPAHRFGAGWWVRCYECPAAELRQAREAWEEQVREERAAEMAQEAAQAARTATEGPPHLSAPGTWRAGLWWGLGTVWHLRQLVYAYGPLGAREAPPPAAPRPRPPGRSRPPEG